MMRARPTCAVMRPSASPESDAIRSERWAATAPAPSQTARQAANQTALSPSGIGRRIDGPRSSIRLFCRVPRIAIRVGCKEGRGGAGSSADSSLPNRSGNAMIHEGIEYTIRASLGRDRWAVLVYFPDNTDERAMVSQFGGTKHAAEGWARRLIDNWLQRQHRKKLSGATAHSTSAHRPCPIRR
jgi:hypothetical protein